MHLMIVECPLEPLYCQTILFKKRNYSPKEINHCYYGPDYSNNEIENIETIKDNPSI